jgi:NAD(P)-dependent dehydrogenase (short-subunit alcohol dehydrogenase family)
MSSLGPVVVISGGATGIGRTMAQRFLAAGYRVHIGDADPAAVAQFSADHPDASASCTDVSRPVQVDAMFDEVARRYGRLDVLINNAGISGPNAPVEEISTEDWERTIAVDLNGQFFCARRAVPMLRAAGGGSIISIASNAALFGVPMRSPYAASKWAIIGFTKTLAMELGPDGIRVNAICPGCVKGPRIDGVIERDALKRGRTPQEIRDVYLKQASMRLFVSADDVANMALFLASEQGAVISGQSIAVDGHTESLSINFD